MSSHGNGMPKDIPQSSLAQPGKHNCLVTLRTLTSSFSYNKKAFVKFVAGVSIWRFSCQVNFRRWLKDSKGPFGKAPENQVFLFFCSWK